MSPHEDGPRNSADGPLPLDQLPQALRAGVLQHWQRYCERAAAVGLHPPVAPGRLAALCRVWASSDFVANACVQNPEVLDDLFASGDLDRSYPPEHYASALAAVLPAAVNDDDLGRLLRRFRSREMVRIAWRDLADGADLDETLAETSALAEACIDGALHWLHGRQREELGVPIGAGSGAEQALVVLGMGKLGARELNFSSDVDLIFAFPDSGTTRGGGRELSNEEYFARLGQRLIRALDEPTAEGFVFRVDMRLRPYGESGRLVLSFAALETYYQSQGRDWERYAMIKARVVAGDRAAGSRLLRQLRPFVYRRYLDFGAFGALRDMKAMIVREVQLKGLEQNIKLGPGGIREVEFIGQAFQLIRGGRQPALREQQIQKVLALLADGDLIPSYAARQLVDAYRFLRRAENRLQELADRQTHELPRDALGRLRVAFAMGFADWDDLAVALRRHRERVAAHFEQIFAAPQDQQAEGPEADLAAVWCGAISGQQAEGILARTGYGDSREALRSVRALRDSHACRALSEQGRVRLDRLMPLLLGAVGGSEDPDRALPRVMALIETIARRTAYLALLVEYPMALSQLVKLAGASPWIARLLTRHPILLDQLLDPRTLYLPATRGQLNDELSQRLAAVAHDDLEEQMEVLRHFKQSNVLRVAAADVAGAMPLMVVSDHLTWIAEVVLGQVLRLAWEQIAARHGTPSCIVDGVRRNASFAIVAYGKLGGFELSYGSDLDLVFLHDSAGEAQTTDGERPVENAVFFARLGQRIIHLLNTATASGVLYEVDTRLRPSGSAGLLVSSIAAFASYQDKEAWTWEHQALTRARPVAGNAEIARRFDAIRAAVLARPRDPASLRLEVREMRLRMRTELGTRGAGWFDLKQDEGGIADIEFMVQYHVLRWAQDHPAVYEYPDNIRQLQALAREGLMGAADAERLIDIYRTLRSRIHQLKLQEQAARVPDTEFREYRAEVVRQWRALMEAPEAA